MVNLKDAIVIKNQFTNKSNSGYGKSLDNYIMRYVTRKGATEPLTPIQVSDFEVTDFIVDYMARREATEALKSSGVGPERVVYETESMLKLDGRAFGSKGLSYSDDTLRSDADRMQELFENDHTVLKTVISFRTDYLQDLGILPDDFVMSGRGAFAGQLDQLKLRQSLNKGIGAMTSSAGFDEPLWVGTIQVDTNHVHAHIVTSEEGQRTAEVDGQERGKLTSKDKSVFRGRFDSVAREASPLASYNKEVSQARHEVVNDVVNVVSSQYKTSSKLQLLIASLPDDTKLWRHDSNAKVMRKPHELMTNYLESLSTNPSLSKSFDKAKTVVEQYATRRYDLYQTPKKESIDKGMSLLESRLSNGIYNHLKRRKLELDTDTDYLKSQAEDDDVLKKKIQEAQQQKANQRKNIELDLLAYRMNQYRKRLKEHSKAEDFYGDADRSYQEQYDAGNASVESKPVGCLYHVMYDYNSHLVDKYRYMLGSDSTREQQNSLQGERDSLKESYNHLKIVHDFGGYPEILDREKLNSALVNSDDYDYEVVKSLQLLDNNEGLSNDDVLLVQSVLSENDLTDVVTFREIDDEDFEKQRGLYMAKLTKFNRQSRRLGLVTANAPLVDDGTLSDVETLDLTQELSDDYFDGIKALDLSDLSYDFDIGASHSVSERTLQQFGDSVKLRRDTYDSAVDYMLSTGQNASAFDAIAIAIEIDEETFGYIDATGELPLTDTFVDDDATARNLSSISLQESQHERLEHDALVLHENLELSKALENDLLEEEARQLTDISSDLELDDAVEASKDGDLKL